EFDNPQFRVANDTSLTFHADDAQQITLNTPRPAEAYSAEFVEQRSLPDGSGILFGVRPPYAQLSFWATPTASVSTVSYHLKANWVLGHPLVNATVTAPQQLTLHPIYPSYSPGNSVRFAGSQSLQVVDAGTGSSDDFASINARGKLAFIRIAPGGCLVDN